MIANLPFMSEEKEIAYNENCTLYEVNHGQADKEIVSGRFVATNISFKINSFEVLFERISKADVSFDGDLAFSTRNSKGSHFEIRCKDGFAANMYLEIYKRYK